MTSLFGCVAQTAPTCSNSELAPPGAYAVQLSSTEHQAERKEVFKYFAKGIAELNSDPYLVARYGRVTADQISTDLYDLDGDGRPEIIAQVSANPIFCWGTGCATFVFHRGPSGLVQIAQFSGRGQLFIGPNKHEGHSDLDIVDCVARIQQSTWIWHAGKYGGPDRIAFSYNDVMPIRAEIKKYFAQSAAEVAEVRKEQGLPPDVPEIGIAKYDLDDDGQQEWLVYYRDTFDCGSHGCAFYVFKVGRNSALEPMKWHKNADFTISYDKIAILPSTTHSFHDIQFDLPDGRVAHWNGQEYQ